MSKVTIEARFKGEPQPVCNSTHEVETLADLVRVLNQHEREKSEGWSYRTSMPFGLFLELGGYKTEFDDWVIRLPDGGAVCFQEPK